MGKLKKYISFSRSTKKQSSPYWRHFDNHNTINENSNVLNCKSTFFFWKKTQESFKSNSFCNPGRQRTTTISLEPDIFRKG